MSSRFVPRLTVGFLLSALWLSMLATPAAAATHVRWVDDGGSGGPAACSTAGYTSIQDAIDASGPWDKVYVCPGTYTEQLTLDVRGIKVQSRPTRRAHIVAPATMDSVDHSTALVRMTSWGATFVGFSLDIPAGGVIYGANPGVVSCSQVDVAVLALGQRERVRRNHIRSTGDNTLSGACGYDYGIVFVGDSPTAVFGSPYPSETSRATRNNVRDFKAGGILVAGDALARLDNNKISYLHSNDEGSGCLPITETFGLTAPAPSACTGAYPLQSALNGIFFANFGIGIEDGALADVQSNTIISNGEATPIGFAPGEGPALYTGIWLIFADGATRVRGNTIAGTFVGILNGFAEPADAVTTFTPTEGPEIVRNTVTDSFGGIVLDSFGANHVHDNAARLNFFGIVAVGSEDNVIHDNDFRFNFFVDCLDETSGAGTEGTANNWYDNLGNNNEPAALCTPYSPFPF